MRLLPIVLLLTTTAFGQSSYMAEIARHRDAYKTDFLKSGNSPLKNEADLAALRLFAPDSACRVVATVKRTTDTKPFETPTYSGETSPYVSYAVVVSA